ncbi:MAG: nicotinate (nicotinamide) nucleotide adenylyltransferase [Ruminococcaceae bacterium]|nr:nicotinate (nicotinamide) nucleotide adenylyltransferase [Oscillospiraceae bacterium]
MIKTGVFGGAFNPVHNGHINLAREAVEQLKLRKLMIIPTYDSPHKDTELVSYEHRAKMCEMAFAGISDKCDIEITDIEQRMGGVSYTINTLRELKRMFPERQFFLLIGGDMLYTFREWFKYESLLKECKVCAVARGGDSFTDMLEFATELGRVKVLPTGIVDVSSTEIRERTARGESISEFVPEAVARYISENNLWR